MATYALQPLGGWRNEALSIPIVVVGIDLTGKALRLQARLAPDTPGAALLDLSAVGAAGVSGIRLVSVTWANGIPTSTLMLQVSKAAMQALPYAGEIGDPTTLAYAMQLDGITRLCGPFAALASAIDSDAAPANRVPAFGGARFATAPSGVTMAIGGDGITVSIVDAVLLGPYVQAAETAAAAANAGMLGAQASAALAAAKALIAQIAAGDAGTYLAAVRQLTGGSPTTAQLPLEATSRAVLGGFAGMVAGRQAFLSEPGREGMFRWASGDQSARVAADGLQGIYVAPTSDPSGASGAWFRIVVSPTLPEWWGAQGDGVTNDQPAFTALSKFVSSSLGGVIDLRSVIYRVGFQYAAGSFYLYGGNIFDFNFAGSVVIRGNGAVLKFNGDMKFGTFDPATGNPYPSKAPYYDNGMRRADLGQGVYAWNLTLFEMSNITFDLNVQKQQIGGEWGDLGRQCNAYGYFIRDCLDVRLNSVHVRNSPLDGGSVANYTLAADGSSPPRPVLLVNCSTDIVARNGLSVLGTNQFLAINCSTDNSGSAPNDVFGPFGTAPGSGLDIEAEGAPCRNIRFDKCRFGKATGNAVVADSGDTQDITFRDCEINGIFYVSKLFTRAYGCKFVGAVRKFVGGFGVQDGGTLFSDCTFIGNRPGDLVIDSQGSGYGTFRGTTKITIATGGVNLRGSWFDDALIEVLAGAVPLDSTGLVGYIEGTRGNQVEFRAAAANPSYWLRIDQTVKIAKANATGAAYWGVAGPTFQGRLYAGKVTVAASGVNAGATTAYNIYNLALFGARVGDLVETTFNGSSTGADFYGVVSSDDALSVVCRRPPGTQFSGGDVQVRLAKEKAA